MRSFWNWQSWGQTGPGIGTLSYTKPGELSSQSQINYKLMENHLFLLQGQELLPPILIVSPLHVPDILLLPETIEVIISRRGSHKCLLWSLAFPSRSPIPPPSKAGKATFEPHRKCKVSGCALASNIKGRRPATEHLGRRYKTSVENLIDNSKKSSQ